MGKGFDWRGCIRSNGPGRWFVHQPLLVAGSVGGVIVGVGLFFWARIDARRTYVKPLIPNALKLIDSRIDIEWAKYFGTKNQVQKEQLKLSIRRGLTFLNMVKTQQEYAKEEIAKITNDKDHPYNHPENPDHEMALRRMIELREMAYSRNLRETQP